MRHPPDRLTVNGQPVEVWPQRVIDLWVARVEPRFRADDQRTVTSANYFTPRPWRNEYDRGSQKEGFVYVLGARDVCYAEWLGTTGAEKGA